MKRDSLFENIIIPFKNLYGLSISFHDYSGKLRSLCSPNSMYHSNPCCVCVKEYGEEKCRKFDCDSVRMHLNRFPNGFFKCCHAGIVEGVFPLCSGTTIQGIMFIGQFLWDSSEHFPDDLLVSRAPIEANDSMSWEHSLIEITGNKLPDLFEVGNTIKCRFEQILEQTTLNCEDEHSLKWKIERYIRSNFTKDISLGSLARHLSLSESRTGHTVKETFGITFPELINQYKIEHAKSLLCFTNLPVCEVAYRSGFADPGYFHRVFRTCIKHTPGNYRKSEQKMLEV